MRVSRRKAALNPQSEIRNRRIGFVSHDLSSRDRRSPDRHNGRNWVCLCKTPRPASPRPRPIRSRREIGFVSHDFPSRERRSPDRHTGGNWLCFAHQASDWNTGMMGYLARWKLGLFRTFRCHATGGSLKAKGLGDGLLRPSGANWLCFERGHLLLFSLLSGPPWFTVKRGLAKSRSFAPTSRRGRHRGRPYLIL